MNVWLISLIILVMLIQSYNSVLCPSRSVASSSYVHYSAVVLVHVFVGWVISLYCVYIEDAVDSVIDLLIFLLRSCVTYFDNKVLCFVLWICVAGTILS